MAKNTDVPEELHDLWNLLAHHEDVVLVEETNGNAVRVVALSERDSVAALDKRDADVLAVGRFARLEEEWAREGLPLRNCYVVLRGPTKPAWFAYVKHEHALPRELRGHRFLDSVANTWLQTHKVIDEAVDIIESQNLVVPKQWLNAPVAYRNAQLQLAYHIAFMRKITQDLQGVDDEAHARGAVPPDVALISPQLQTLLNQALAEARRHKSPKDLIPDVRKWNKRHRRRRRRRGAARSQEPAPEMAALAPAPPPARAACAKLCPAADPVASEWRRLAQRRERTQKRRR